MDGFQVALIVVFAVCIITAIVVTAPYIAVAAAGVAAIFG